VYVVGYGGYGMVGYHTTICTIWYGIWWWYHTITVFLRTIYLQHTITVFLRTIYLQHFCTYTNSCHLEREIQSSTYVLM
jgi:hypothetical protein